MASIENPQLFPCDYVRIHVRLKDQREYNWTHWVPNKAVEKLFGITSDEPYLSGEEYANKQARGYLENGIYHLSGGVEEYITPDKIDEVSTTVEKKELTMEEIVTREAHLSDACNVTIRPSHSKKPTLQQAIDAIDELLHGKTTVNVFFEKLRLPKSSKPGADVMLTPTHEGFVAPDGMLVNIRLMFPDDTLYMIVELMRRQKLNG